ncbi:CDP-diacylglycerol--serine O-phosphatidyltransferase [Helicobacter enhydrae]|uniref:CDP-diacylglycerol--serine O-phosphatidyltransferase n=1 Tax=Helicobacter enhydrae TaxID=222136 RepID=A0A1B1U5R9_9HELI|nr:CDP-diacylglycerol--serine O-phosphatidyltransferase [Helicobacter enhydrae]ANV98098.1 CDP-diacylglycerol--serine O-phosphatidyltransferase [Helicobacter enhydrae]
MKINPLYVLPNAFTAGSIFLAIISIISSAKEDFTLACWAIVASMILDGLDGRVARLTNTSSKFGVEFDSLADIVAFGVAPAMLVYFYIGQYYGRFGLVVCALFVIFGAIRLARFNITTHSEPNFFIGLPIPSAAVILVTWILFNQDYTIFEQPKVVHNALDNSLDILIGNPNALGYISLSCVLLVGVLMVSNIRYPSFKAMTWNLKTFIVLLLLCGILIYRPIEFLTFFMSGYVIYGLGRWAFLLTKIRRS